MLSKKMAVSLMSLIIICALAFVAPAAMAAGTFEVELAEHDDQPDVGDADGLQIERPSDLNLKVKVMFGQAVDGSKVKPQIGGFDKDGAYIPEVVLGKVDPNNKIRSTFTIEITITSETTKVALLIDKGIASADAFNDDTSKELMREISLVDSRSDLAPQVYGIRRADNSQLPVASGAVNVIITLSEKPKTFTAAHIDVSGGTAEAPVASATIRQSGVGSKGLLDSLVASGDLEAVPEVKTVEEIRTLINANIKLIGYTDGNVNDDQKAALKKLYYDQQDIVDLETKLRTSLHGAPGNYRKYHYKDGDNKLQSVTIVDAGNSGTNADGNRSVPLPIVNGVIAEPTKEGIYDLANASTDPAYSLSASKFDRSKKKTDYTRPNRSDYDTQEAYDAAKGRYDAEIGDVGWNSTLTTPAWADNGYGGDSQRAQYLKEKAIYDAYIALEDAIEKYEMEKYMEWEKDKYLPAASKVAAGEPRTDLLPPTGRDSMLHQYSVVITPTYASDPVVVKVESWVNTSADPQTYKPPVLASGYIEGYDMLTIPVTKTPAPSEPSPTGVIQFLIP